MAEVRVPLEEDPDETKKDDSIRHRMPPMPQWCSIDVAERTLTTSLAGVVTYELVAADGTAVAIAASPELFLDRLAATPQGAYTLRLTTERGSAFTGPLDL